MIKGRKFESLDGIFNDVEEYFDQFCDEDSFADNDAANDTTDDCIEYLISDCGYSESIADSQGAFNKIKRYLISLADANEACKHESDEEDDDDIDEACRHKELESRIRRLERLISKR